MPAKRSKPSRISAPARRVAQDICTLIGQERTKHGGDPSWAAALGYMRSVIAKTYRLSEEYGFVKMSKPPVRKGLDKSLSRSPETEKTKKTTRLPKIRAERDKNPPPECVDLLHQKPKTRR